MATSSCPSTGSGQGTVCISTFFKDAREGFRSEIFAERIEQLFLNDTIYSYHFVHVSSIIIGKKRNYAAF